MPNGAILSGHSGGKGFLGIFKHFPGFAGLAKRICSADGKGINDKRMICDLPPRVSKALRSLRDKGAVAGEKDRARRFL